MPDVYESMHMCMDLYKMYESMHILCLSSDVLFRLKIFLSKRLNRDVLC